MTNQHAIRSADFLDTLGVQTHVPYTDGGYANIGNIAADLSYLGITQVRDGISDGLWGSASLASFIKLAQQGVTFTIGVIDSTVKDNATLNARLDLVRRLVAAVPGSVTAIEGANEINNWPVTFNGVGGLQGAIDMQRALYSAVHSDPALAGIAVDYFTGYAVGSIGAGPDPSTTPGLADYDTQHPYPRNGDAPGAYIDPANAAANETPGQTGPLVYTETGYSSNGGTWGAVDQNVQARYTLDLLFDAAQAGVAQTDLYELMDAYATGSPQGNAGFGLFDTANRPKLVATAIHNLTTILADKGATAATFQTGGFSPVLTGLPATGQSLILQKSNGASDLVVWAEPKIWNPATGTEIAPPTQSVTAALGATYATVSVFDPLVGTAPVQTFSNVSAVTLALTDHPLIVEVSGLVAAPTVTINAQRLAQDTGLSGTDNVTSNGTVTLSGTMTGAAGTSVQVLDGKIVLGVASLGAGGAWSFTTTLAKGTHALSATATDPYGFLATAQAAAPITVITDPPTIALGAVAIAPDGRTATLTGTVSGASGTGVTVYNGTALLGAATLDGQGGWSFATSLAPGSYTLAAVATDLAGNTTSIAPSVVIPGATVAPVTASPDTLVLRLSEDAYNGDAQFSVTVDGTAVGGVQSVSAPHRLGQTQDFTFTGAFGTGTHAIGVNFLNDLYRPGVGDRNLYVNAIILDGTTTTLNTAQMSQGIAAYQVTTPSAGPDVLTLNLSEDAYLGDAQFTVSVDGRQVGGTQSVTASHSAGQSATLSIIGSFGTGVHTVGVNFLNDLYKPGIGDRNLYVSSIALDGTTTAVNTAQMSGGTKSYRIQTSGGAAALPAVPTLSVGAGATLILDKGAAAGAAVTFGGAKATLQLTDAAGFQGTIAGFAKSDTLDLRSIAFSGSTAPTLAYAGNASGGTLTVSDGTHRASLSLLGAYGASSFTMAADGAGGVAIGLSQ